MKKFYSKLCYITCIFFVFSFVLFCLNLLKKTGSNKSETEKEIIKDEELKKENFDIDYKGDIIINVLITSTGETVAMDINDYLRGVVPAEMPPYYNVEALKAQAIVARTYLYRKINDNAHDGDTHICDNFAHCQAFYTKEKIFEIWEAKGYDEETRNKYWENVNEAVVSTEGKVIKYNGQYIKAFFHASSPNRTEDVSQIWSGTSYPYLVSVENQEAEDYDNRTSQVEVSINEFISKLNESGDTNIAVEEVEKSEETDIHISEYTTSGRVKYIEVCGFEVKAEVLRTYFGLKSTDFTFEIKDNMIIFHVTGNGHGVGMSQVGANSYAESGMTCDEIIEHYYTGAYVVKEN